MQSYPGEAISKDSEDRTPRANRPLPVWGERQVENHPLLGSCKQINQQWTVQYLRLNVQDRTQFFKSLPDGEQAPATWLMSNWCPKGRELEAYFSGKFSANYLFPKICSFRAAESFCQSRSTPHNCFQCYEKWLAPPWYQNECFCLINSTFHCTNNFQKLTIEKSQ